MIDELQIGNQKWDIRLRIVPERLCTSKVSGRSLWHWETQKQRLFGHNDWTALIIRRPTIIGSEQQFPRFHSVYVAHCWMMWFAEEIKSKRSLIGF